MMLANKFIFIILFIYNKYEISLSFNVDTGKAFLIEGLQERSSFGHSVDLWKDNNDTKWVVIGAPFARKQLDKSSNLEYTIGSIVLCNSPNYCIDVEKLPGLNDKNITQMVIDISTARNSTTFVGLGELIHVPKTGNELLVCAPRFPGLHEAPSITHFAFTLRGACYILSQGTQNPNTVAPFEDNRLKVLHSKKLVKIAMPSANAGTSALLIGNNEILMGAPSLYKSRGAVYKVNIEGPTNKLHMANFFNTYYDYHFLRKSFYEGWAMARGNFDGTSDCYAVSRFYRDSMLGNIIFYNTTQLIQVEPRPELRLEEEESGSKYGHALTSGDFNGDGSDDLVVAAPWSTVTKVQPNSNQQYSLVDSGKVFVYYVPLKRDSNALSSMILEGNYMNGLFGYSIACPGDLNNDGYDDLLVGAPYETKNGRVYVYSGSKQGLLPIPSQVITSTDLVQSNKPMPKSLGFSVGGGIDLDSNGFPDIVIGAKDANSAFVLRTSPVIKLKIKASFNNSAELVYLGDKSCKVKNTNVACLNMTLDVQFVSHLLLDEKLPVSISIMLDVTQTESRLLQMESDKRQISIIRSISNSQKGPDPFNVYVYIIAGKVSRLEPIQTTVNVSLLSLSELETKLQARTPITGFESPFILPILDKFSKNVLNTKSIRIICEDAETCLSKPDLILEVTAQPEFIVGSSDRLVMNVSLETKQEPAYNIKLEANLPSQFNLERVLGYTKHEIRCVASEYENEDAERRQFSCVLVNYLSVGNEINFGFLLTHSVLDVMNATNLLSEFVFKFAVASDSNDTDVNNNKAEVKMNAKVSSKSHIHSKIVPEIVSIWTNDSQVEDKLLQLKIGSGLLLNGANKIGPLFSHRYSLVNSGPSPIIRANVTLSWPSYIGDLPITLFSESIITEGDITCVSLPKNLTLQRSAVSEFSSISSSTIDRVKRAVAEFRPTSQSDAKTTEKKNSKNDMSNLELSCSSVHCIQIQCLTGVLYARDEFAVEIRAVAVGVVLQNLKHHHMTFTSNFEIESPTVSIKATETASTLFIVKEQQLTVVGLFTDKWWIPLSCIAAGLLIILIIAGILYKVGFFKRKRVVRPPARSLSYRESHIEDSSSLFIRVPNA